LIDRNHQSRKKSENALQDIDEDDVEKEMATIDEQPAPKIYPRRRNALKSLVQTISPKQKQSKYKPEGEDDVEKKPATQRIPRQKNALENLIMSNMNTVDPSFDFNQKRGILYLLSPRKQKRSKFNSSNR